MAFLKYATAAVVKPITSLPAWDEVRLRAMQAGTAFDKRIAAQVVLQEFDPNQFLLSHCTIIASVDTEKGPGVLGRHFEGGFTVNRRYADYYIRPGTSKYVNNNCFVPGTAITMSDGSVRPIELVREGDLVRTHLGRVRKVNRIFQRDISEDLLEIKPRGTTERLYVTREHPFFAFRPVAQCVHCDQPISRSVRVISHLLGRHYCSKECYYAHRVPNSKYLQDKTGEFVPAGDLTKRDFLSIPVVTGETPTGLTPGQARLIGLFAAEGYYELDSGKDNERVGVCWAFHADECSTLAATVIKLLSSEFGWEGVIREHSTDNGIHVTTRTNRKLVEFFRKWVRGEDSTTKFLEASLLEAERHIQLEIFRGWAEGDGCYLQTRTDSRLSVTSASRSLANQMQMMLHRLGVSSHLTHSVTEGRRRLLIDGVPKVVSDPTKECHAWTVSSGSGWVGEIVEDTVYAPLYDPNVQAVPALRFLNSYHLQIVEKLGTVSYTGPVYNFDVEEDHSYIANGVAVHNCDSWERKLLLATFKTFVGGENYVEHLQIPELSKGKIIDAAARDIGDSIYIDILVATDRKHKPLIDAISSSQLSTLSMGCQVSHTTCSKCGNTSEDETQLCSHIRYSKGNTFVDGLGQQRKIAELCGHYSDPSSVKFIEASWVANPAFTGAVLRNIFSPQEIANMSPKMQLAFSQPTRVADPTKLQKAARRSLFSAAPEENPTQGEGEPPAEAAPEDPMEKAVEDMADHIRQKAIEKVRGEMTQAPKETPGPSGSENMNDTLIKSALAQNTALRQQAMVVAKSVKNPLIARRIIEGLVYHQQGGWQAVKNQKFSGREILAISRFQDLLTGHLRMAGDNRIYRTVVAVGGAAAYSDLDSYLFACRRVIGRDMTQAEKEALIVKGRLYDLGQ